MKIVLFPLLDVAYEKNTCAPHFMFRIFAIETGDYFFFWPKLLNVEFTLWQLFEKMEKGYMQYYAFLAPQIKALKRAFKIRLEIIEIISKISM